MASKGSSDVDQDAEWLKERISCCVCLEIFDKPHTLPCLHSLCQSCIEGLKPVQNAENELYKCPLCDEHYMKENVRNNFLIAELIDFHQMLTTRNASAVCKQCEKELPTHRCLECKADLCGPCKGFHDKFELMKTHHTVSLDSINRGVVIDKHIFCTKHNDELIKLNCVPCETPICAVCKATDHDGHKCESTADALNRLIPVVKEMQAVIQHNITKVRAKKVDVTKEVKAMYNKIESLEREVKKIHLHLKTKLDNDQASLLDELKHMRKDIEDQEKNSISRLELHIKESNHVTEWVDTVTGSAQGTSLLQELQSGVRTKLVSMTENIKGSSCDLEQVTKLDDKVSKLVLMTNAPVVGNSIGTFQKQQSGFWPFQLQRLCDSKPRNVSSVALGNVYGVFLGVINDQIWIPATKFHKSIIAVYETDGSFVTNIDLPDAIRCPRAVTEYQDATRVAIIASDLGLFEISLDGSINSKIHDGEFSDVCVVGPTVYALEYIKHKVHAFKNSSKTWTTTKSIVLNGFILDMINGSYSTLKVVEDFIHVYQYSTPEAMIKYNMDGLLLGKYGDEGEGADTDAGNLFGGRICGYDNAGSLLVCDDHNERLQVLDAEGKWSITQLNHLGFKPRYAVPIDENTFCILEFGGKLHFYTIK